MAHESFEDEEVAACLNQYFVAIKVDKEERPDVDSIYMSVCQQLTGSGGWPLTIFMFPNQKPFYAGTYFPKKSTYHMPGLLDLLEAVQEKWKTDRAGLADSSEAITASLNDKRNGNLGAPISKEPVKEALRSLKMQFDEENGGFGKEPKFPMPHNLMFLLRAAMFEKDEKALEMAEKTLTSMYHGGIFDHIGYGFSRYSTDTYWLVPHFEKMLYDNALLLLAYLEAYQFTGNKIYQEAAEKIITYVSMELTHKEGGFYCAQDADSQGEEGKYYVFRPEEIINLLGKEDGAIFNDYYGITEEGNFEGASIPNRIHGTAVKLNPKYILRLQKKVYEYRKQRMMLHKDDKILTSWNGIMIAAFAKAYQVLKKGEYLQAAVKADEFLNEHLSNNGRLLVHYRENHASGEGHIDDYAFYAWGLIGLYEATYDCRYLERAREYMEVMIQDFFDEEEGGFYLYGKDGETLIHRPKELYDGAIPSGNSVAGYVLGKLVLYTADHGLSAVLEKHMSFIGGNLKDYPSAYCFSLMAMMQELYKGKELICLLPDHTMTGEMKETLSKYFLPHLTILVITKENQDYVSRICPFTRDYNLAGKDKAVFYLCENHVCRTPVYHWKEIEELLKKDFEGAAHR